MPFQLSHILHNLYHFTEFFKLNIWNYNVTHLYEVDYRLLSHISSYLYEIFMELFLTRQIDQIAPVLDTCGWSCSVKPLPYGTTLSAIRATVLLANRPRASTRTETSRY